jgi:PAS domain S-box-containing protein
MEQIKIQNTGDQLFQENQKLSQRVTELEETLNAIRSGEVDAIIVSGDEGEKLYSLNSVETLYRVIIEEMNQGAITLTNDGIIVYCNNKFAKLISEPMENIIGSYFVSFLPESEVQKFRELLISCYTGKNSGELTFVKKNGHSLNFLLSLNALPSEILNGVCILFSDITELIAQRRKMIHLNAVMEQKVTDRTSDLNITINELAKEIAERKRSENALRETELLKSGLLLKYNEAQHISKIGSWEWDLKNSQVWWSDETYLIFGTTPRDYHPDFESNSKFIHPDDLEPYGRMFELSFQTGEPLFFECRLIMTDGRLKYCEARGKLIYDEDHNPVSFIGTIADITERKHIEKLLMESEQRFRSYFSLGLLGMAITSVDMKWIEVNDTICSFLGYSSEELMQKTWAELTHPDDINIDVRKFDQVLKNEIDGYKIDKRFIRKNGNTIYTELAVRCIRDAENKVMYFVALINDITERKLSEQSLYKLSRRLELALRSSGAGSWDWDIINGNIVWSSHMFQLLGLDQQKNIASFDNWRAVLHPEDIELAETRINEALKDHSQLNSDYRVILPSGQIRWINATGEGIYDERGIPVQMAGICTDITERKESDLKLKESEEKFKNLVWDMQVGVLLQGPKSEILLCNPKALELLGMNEDQILGKSSLDPEWNVIHEDGSPFPGKAHPVPQAIETLLPVRNVIMGVYNPVIHDRLWLLVEALPQLSNDGTLNQVVCTFIDISERKHAEAQIINMNEVLEQKVVKRTEQLRNSNKELEAFSYSVSHDLRAPLRAVHGYTNILLEEYEDKLDDEAKRLCRIISSSAIKMSGLIDDLLSFSRIGRTSVNPGWLDMNSLVDSVLGDSNVAENINRINYITGKLHRSFGDANLIKLVWNNLIYNAIKYSSKEQTPEIAIGSKNEGNMINYYIKDNGVGFDMQYINKLFGVFQRLHSETEFEGNGVGLAIVQRIVSKHGGRVWAEGEVGKGATFWFCLPASGLERGTEGLRD